jgi:hypothetical protein
MADVSFDQLATLYRSISFDQGCRSGVLRVESDEQVKLLNAILNDEDGRYGISLSDGDPDDLAIGNAVTLDIEHPRLSLGILAYSFDDLLLAPRARVEEPKNYYVIDLRCGKDTHDTPEVIDRYRKVHALINLLKESAAYLDESKWELIYVDNGKFAIPIDYSKSDLQSANMLLIDRLIGAIENDTHKEQKLSILADAVVELSKSSPPKDRFRNLLSHLEELNTKFADGYRIFVSSFSYQKVKDELEAAKIDYTSKIHKAFSDIQNQILGIPVATIIVATQMKAASNFGYEFWVNTSVLIGCYVFVVFTGLMIWNQIHTLAVLDSEIRRQKDQMQHKYSDILERFGGIFTSLEKRLRAQKIALIFVAAVLGVGFVISHVVYFKLTAPARDWANDITISNGPSSKANIAPGSRT